MRDEDAIFGNGFFNALVQVLKRNQPPEPLKSALGEGDHSRGIKSKSVRKFIYTFNRVSLLGLLAYNRLRPFRYRARRDAPAPRDRKAKARALLGSSGEGYNKYWSTALVVLFIIACVSTLTNTYYQYRYDKNALKLRKLRSLLNDTLGRDIILNKLKLDPDRLQAEWAGRSSEARERLKSLGSSHMGWSFMIQSIVLIFLAPAVIGYLLFPAFCELANVSIMLPCGIINERGFEQSRARLILEELNKFSAECLASSHARLEHMHCCMALALSVHPEALMLDHKLNSFRFKTLTIFSARLRQKHHANIDLLRDIALGGWLNPLNSSPVCQDQLALFYFAGFFCMLSYMEGILVVGYLCSMWHFQARCVFLETAHARNYFDIFNLFLIVEVLTFLALTTLVLLGLIFYDLFTSMSKLQKLIAHVLRKNAIIFAQLEQASEAGLGREAWPAADGLGPDLHQNFELDLTVVVMQWRLVSRSFELAKPPLELISIMVIHFAIATPTVFRLHCAYFEPGLRAVGFLVGLACPSYCLSLLYPLGLMHEQSIKTFRGIWSLVGQLSQLESLPGVRRRLGIESSVAALALRREVADSRQTADRFACRVFTVPVTYSKLIKVSFWIFLLIMSLSNNIHIYGERFARLIQDPFGLFNFLRPPKETSPSFG